MSAAALEALPVLAQSHVIKITALMTAIACGTYVFWHTFIKDRPNYNGNGQRPQQQVCQESQLSGRGNNTPHNAVSSF